jgi:hypothetical protein
MDELITYVSGGLLNATESSSCRIDNSMMFSEEDYRELAIMRQTFHENLEGKNLNRNSYTSYLLSLRKEMQRNSDLLHNLCAVFIERYNKRKEDRRDGQGDGGE